MKKKDSSGPSVPHQPKAPRADQRARVPKGPRASKAKRKQEQAGTAAGHEPLVGGALDESLRGLIRAETRKIHTPPITAALREAMSQRPGAAPCSSAPSTIYRCPARPPTAVPGFRRLPWISAGHSCLPCRRLDEHRSITAMARSFGIAAMGLPGRRSKLSIDPRCQANRPLNLVAPLPLFPAAHADGKCTWPVSLAPF